ncbi:helix-turn-helix transcriptional regulator [Clostridium tetani]|nr:helix-turn-helix domain-containing protein [Clostridium tetani]
MRENNLSIPDISRATGLPDSTLRSMISRKTKNISLDVAFKLSEGLGISLEELNGEIPINSEATTINVSNKQNMKEIINRIKTRRNELMLSYQDLANKTGLSKSTLQRYETGAIKNMPIDKLDILAKALNVSPAYLMGWEESLPNNDQEYEKETILLSNFNKLNETGKDEAIKRVEELTEISRYKDFIELDVR